MGTSAGSTLAQAGPELLICKDGQRHKIGSFLFELQRAQRSKGNVWEPCPGDLVNTTEMNKGVGGLM